MTTADEVTTRAVRRFSGIRPASSPPRIGLDGLPPGPRWPGLVQTVALVRFRHRFVPYLHRRYGDVFTVDSVPKGRPLVLFTRPEHAKEIFAGDPEVFHAGKGNAVLGPIMGEHSLLLQDGAEHKRARRLLLPAFNGHALRGYQRLVTDIARGEVAGWREGAEFRSLDRMNALTLEVILRVVLGVADESRLAALRPRVNRVVVVSPVVLLGWSYPWLRRFDPWRRTVANTLELDRLIYDEIAARRAAPDLAERTDVLSQLIRVEDALDDGTDTLTDEELRDQMVTLLLAGHETTATALAWALHEVGRDPEQRRRAMAAARDVGSGGPDGTAWLEAVLKESMRLHPVIPMVLRTLIRPATIGGHDLPAGATVGPSILVAHARADNHPDPETFNPQRFLNDRGDPSAPASGTWIPFGGGVRRCIGAGFSLMEGVAVLREVFAAVDIESLGADEPKVRNITSVPRRGARVRVIRARAGGLTRPPAER